MVQKEYTTKGKKGKERVTGIARRRCPNVSCRYRRQMTPLTHVAVVAVARVQLSVLHRPYRLILSTSRCNRRHGKHQALRGLLLLLLLLHGCTITHR